MKKILNNIRKAFDNSVRLKDDSIIGYRTVLYIGIALILGKSIMYVGYIFAPIHGILIYLGLVNFFNNYKNG